MSDQEVDNSEESKEKKKEKHIKTSKIKNTDLKFLQDSNVQKESLQFLLQRPMDISKWYMLVCNFE